MWHNRVSKCRYGLFSPFTRCEFPKSFKKGSNIQPVGNPIIVSTYRGFRRKPSEVVELDTTSRAIVSSKLPRLRSAKVWLFKSAWFTLFARGVGMSPLCIAPDREFRSDSAGFNHKWSPSVLVGVGISPPDLEGCGVAVTIFRTAPERLIPLRPSVTEGLLWFAPPNVARGVGSIPFAT